MIELLIGQFMPYLALIGVGIAAYFGIKSKVQSHTIDKQEDAIETHKANEAELVKAIETQKKEITLKELANEISNDNHVELDDAIIRLRKLARANRDGDKK